MSENVYYSPGTWGLTVIKELDEDEPYQFHKIVLWQHTNDGLYWAVDSGCSCPSPFEDFTELSDLTRLDHTKRAWKDFDQTVMDCSYWDGPDKIDLLRRARYLLDQTDKKMQAKYTQLQKKIARTGSLF